MSWISLGGERNFNTLMHYTKKHSEEFWNKRKEYSEREYYEEEEGQTSRTSRWQHLAMTIGSTIATIPVEFIACAENLIRLPFQAVGAVIKYPSWFLGHTFRIICCGNNRLTRAIFRFERGLPGLTDVIKTALKVMGFAIGTLLTATLGLFVSTWANFGLHHLVRLINSDNEDPMLKEMLLKIQGYDGLFSSNHQLSSQISGLNRSIREKESEINDLKRSIREKESEISRLKRAQPTSSQIELESQVRALRSQLEEKTRQKSASEEHLAGLRSEINQLNATARRRGEDLQSLMTTKATQEDEIKRLKRSLDSKTEEITRLVSEIKKINDASKTLPVQVSAPAKTMNQEELFRQLQAMPQFHKLLDELLGNNAELDAWKQTSRELEELRQKMAREGVNFSDQASVLRGFEKLQGQTLHLQVQLQQQKTDFERKLNEAGKETEAIRGKLQEALRTNKALEQQIGTLKEENSRWKATAGKNAESLSAKSTELGKLQQQLVALQKEQETHKVKQAELDALRVQLETVRSTMKELEQKEFASRQNLESIKTLEQKLQTEQTAYKAKEHEFTQKLEAIEKAKTALEEEVKKRLRELEEAKRSSSQTLTSKESEISGLKTQVDNLKRDHREASEKVTELKQKLATAEKAKEDLIHTRATSEEFKQELGIKNGEIKTLKSEIEQLKAQQKEASSKVSELTTKLNGLERGKEVLTNELNQLKTARSEQATRLKTLERDKTDLIEKNNKESAAFRSLIQEKEEQLKQLKSTHQAEVEGFKSKLGEMEAAKRALEQRLGTEKQTLALQLQASTGESAQLKAALEALQSCLAMLSKKIHTVVKSNSNPNALDVDTISGEPLQVLEQCVNVIETRLKDQRSSEMQYESQIQVLREQIQDAEQKLREKESAQRESIEKLSKQHQDQLEGLGHEILNLRAALEKPREENQNELNQLRETLKKLEKEYKELQTLHEQNLKENLDYSATVEGLKSKVEEFKPFKLRYQQLVSRYQELQESLEALKDDKADEENWKNRATSAETKARRLSDELKNAPTSPGVPEEEFEKTINKSKELMHRHQQTLEENRKLLEENAALQDDNHELQRFAKIMAQFTPTLSSEDQARLAGLVQAATGASKGPSTSSV